MSPLMWPWAPLNVALRKESVDRNLRTATLNSLPAVALRKESVDRNRDKHEHQTDIILSLSARRAWIEMLLVM